MGLTELVALGLGNAMINILFIPLITGIGNVVQSNIQLYIYHGASEDDRAQIGLQVWRGRLVMTFTIICIAPCLVLSNFILRSMGQDSEASMIAATYVRMTLPSLYLYALMDLERHVIEAYQQEWGQRMRSLGLQLCSPLIHWGICYVLVIKYGWGIAGIGWSYLITFTVVFIT